MCSGHVKQYLPSNLHLIELNKLLTNEKKILNDKGKKKNVKEETKTKEYINKSNYRIFNEKNYDKMSFMQNLEIDKNFATNITEAFLKTQEDIIEREFEVNYSGSTVCSIFILGNIIYCANVGDSRCVLGRYEKDKKLQPLSISRDHKPSEPEEKERILSSGGRVEAFKNEDNEDVGPLRVWLKDEDVPGLAMSRSIGDIVSAKVGVISSPEISLYKISKNDKFLILASDGLWEFVSNEQAVQIVSRFWLIGDADGAVDELIRIASHYWEEVILK
jgi:serine/threonine protein phosphatase PrpC